MKTEFDVSFKKNGVYQARIVIAKNKEFAERWFRFIEPKAVVLGVRENYDYKPGKPVEEVPDDWNGIVFDDVLYKGFLGKRKLFFDIPLEYFSDDYFDEEYREKIVSVTLSIAYDPDCPSYGESAFNIVLTDIDGNDLDWFRYDMSLEEYQMFMGIAKKVFHHTINVSFVHGTDADDPDTDETQFDLDDENGDYSEVELFNLIIDFFKENHFIDPYVTGIWEV